jgi:hypothetical protein
MNRRPSPCSSIVEANELVKIIRLGNIHYVAAFTLMKLPSARFMLTRYHSSDLRSRRRLITV